MSTLETAATVEQKKQEKKDELKKLIEKKLPDNHRGQITAADVREVLDSRA